MRISATEPGTTVVCRTIGLGESGVVFADSRGAWHVANRLHLARKTRGHFVDVAYQYLRWKGSLTQPHANFVIRNASLLGRQD